MRQFDFSAGKTAAVAAGLGFSDEIADQVDPQFVALGLTQPQVDQLLRLHVHYLKWALNTSVLSFWRRVVFAAWILRGGAK